MHDPIDDAATGSAPAGARIGVVLSAVLAAVVLTTNLPRIDATLHPVLGEQRISNVVRTPGMEITLRSGPHAGEKRWLGATMCWERLSFKHHTAPVDNLDVFLDRRDPETGAFSPFRRTFPEVYVEDSGDPVATDEAPAAGWTRRRLCIRLPSKVAPDQPLRLEQFAHFRGLWNLWELPPTALPVIVSEGATEAPPSP